MSHELKTDLLPFGDLWNRVKAFEVRKNDRDYQLSDELLLKEWTGLGFTGRWIRAEVSYINEGGQYGIEPGYVVLGIFEIDRSSSPLTDDDEIFIREAA